MGLLVADDIKDGPVAQVVGQDHIRRKGSNFLIKMGIGPELVGDKAISGLYIRQTLDGNAVLRDIFRRFHIAQMGIVHISFRRSEDADIVAVLVVDAR